MYISATGTEKGAAFAAFLIFVGLLLFIFTRVIF